jgi:hypothetical protein
VSERMTTVGGRRRLRTMEDCAKRIEKARWVGFKLGEIKCKC